MASQQVNLAQASAWFNEIILPQRTTVSGFSGNRIWKSPRGWIVGHTEDPNGLCGGDRAVPRKTAAVPDLDRHFPLFAKRLQPATGSDIHICTDRDPVRLIEADRGLDHASLSELGERRSGQHGEDLAPSAS